MSKGRHTGNTNIYAKDIRRSILHAKKRFISIIVITLLGVMMFSGLQASCHDLRISADSFFDKQKLHDITVQSTLGLTEEDVKALSEVKGVKEAEGVYSEEDDIKGMKDEDARQTVEFLTLGDLGMDQPYLKKGRLPEKASEAAVTEEFSRTTGLKVGDTFQIAENSDSSDQSSNQTTASSSAQTSTETSIQSSTQTSDQAAAQNSAQSSTVTTTQTSALKGSEFTITGIVIDPTRMDNPFSSVSYRKNANDKIRAFILEDAVDSDIYTSINLRLTGAGKLLCYSTSYEDLVNKVVKRIENQVMEDREQARTEEVREQAVQSYEEALQKQMAVLQQQMTGTASGTDAAGASANVVDIAAGQTDAQTAGSSTAASSASQADQSSALQSIQDSIDPAVWYVQDRLSLSGYSNIRSDADSIESIGTVFPIVFLAVAVLICLTTVARMVDEDRGLIGTYKSLGYTDREIRKKYMDFALLACLIGSVGGTIMAFVAFPKFIFTVFSIMYLLPISLAFCPASLSWDRFSSYWV
jgi:putative ABC transport system permease protein